MKNLKLYTKFLLTYGAIDVMYIIMVIVSYTGAKKAASAEDTAAFMKQYNLTLGLMVALAAVVLTITGLYLGRIIRISFSNLKKAANEVAEGKINVKLTKERNDEFGDLADDFQKVVNITAYHAKVAEEVANGNMSIQVKSSERDVLGNALQKLVERNNHSLSNIKDAATQVSSSSSEVSGAAESLAQGSTEQASAIEEITASIEDIAGKTKNNAQEANQAAKLMEATIRDVKKGNEHMQNMTVAMDDINKSSESISKIIKVIDDIAFQTNILALNAAVEAARAGDAGKGFAVVAEEVRNLAAKSLAAAAETAEMIEDSISKVNVGSEIATETAKALEEITKNVKECEKMIQGIAEESNYQATAISQIDQAVEQVSQVVQTNSATSQQCAAASVELAKQAERMNEMLSYYKLDASKKEPSDLLSEYMKSNKEKTDAQYIKKISLEDDFMTY